MAADCGLGTRLNDRIPFQSTSENNDRMRGGDLVKWQDGRPTGTIMLDKEYVHATTNVLILISILRAQLPSNFFSLA